MQKSLARTIGTLSLEYLLRGNAAGSMSNGGSSGFPLLFKGVYSFLAGSHFAHPVPVIWLAPGVVPVGLAAGYLVLHLTAHHRETLSRKERRLKQLRKRIYCEVVAHPAACDPVAIMAGDELHSGIRFVTEVLDDSGDAHYVYHLPELAQRLEDVATKRASPPPR